MLFGRHRVLWAIRERGPNEAASVGCDIVSGDNFMVMRPAANFDASSSSEGDRQGHAHGRANKHVKANCCASEYGRANGNSRCLCFGGAWAVKERLGT